MVDPVLVLYMHIIDMHIVNYDYVYPPSRQKKKVGRVRENKGIYELNFIIIIEICPIMNCRSTDKTAENNPIRQ